jgi:hypothetical protein
MGQDAISSQLANQFVRTYAKEQSMTNSQNFVAGPRDRSIANQAADWELNQCCTAFEEAGYDKFAVQLRHLRRPKDPVERLKDVEQLIERQSENWCPTSAQWSAIREALREARCALSDKEDQS